jgi:hypothetical protein
MRVCHPGTVALQWSSTSRESRKGTLESYVIGSLTPDRPGEKPNLGEGPEGFRFDHRSPPAASLDKTSYPADEAKVCLVESVGSEQLRLREEANHSCRAAFANLSCARPGTVPGLCRCAGKNLAPYLTGREPAMRI